MSAAHDRRQVGVSLSTGSSDPECELGTDPDVEGLGDPSLLAHCFDGGLEVIELSGSLYRIEGYGVCLILSGACRNDQEIAQRDLPLEAGS